MVSVSWITPMTLVLNQKHLRSKVSFPSGKKAVLRARSLVEQGADTIAFASCISKGTPIGYPCPFAKRMRELVQKEVGDGVRILDYTHDAGPEPETSQK